MTETCDKKRRPIRVGDVLKVYHFTAALRREKQYMYKQVIRSKWLGGYGNKPKTLYFVVSHLSLTDKDTYYIGLNEGCLADYEIVQSIKCDHQDRKKVEIEAMEAI